MSWWFGLAPPHHTTVPHTGHTITSTREIAQNVEPSALPNIWVGSLRSWMKLERLFLAASGDRGRARWLIGSSNNVHLKQELHPSKGQFRACEWLRHGGKRNPPKPGRLGDVGGLES
jgi:hypothetical protein